MVQTAIAIQDQMQNNHCHGCGTENPKGLQIKSYWVDENTTECRFEPQPHHCAGPLQYLNGGIIASVIDCHAVGTAMAKAYMEEGREVGEGDQIWFVTGKLDLNFYRPTLIDQEALIIAKVEEVKPKKVVLNCELSSNGEVCVIANVIAIRAPNNW
jgi:acyl-coenzyme A thioesterase PaaI-like protein